jgi:uncharacterized protein YndB with AHSA1/START domain
MPATTLSLNRLIKAPREKVFAAWTRPEALQQWWGPGPVTCPEAHVDLREGGSYRIANLELDGSITWISGEFHRVQPPEELVYTWNVSIVAGDATLVTLRLREHPVGTELILIHERFVDDAVRDMHGQGWGLCIDKLEAFLATA